MILIQMVLKSICYVDLFHLRNINILAGIEDTKSSFVLVENGKRMWKHDCVFIA